MPFVSPKGGEHLNHDIKEPTYNMSTGRLEDPGNGLRDLELTGGTAFDYEPNGEKFHEIIWRGTPDPANMNWIEMPVYRLQNHKFKSGHEWIENDEERVLTDWGRFMRDYEAQVTGRAPSRAFFFEPHITDIEESEDNLFTLPMWVIDKLIEFKEFEQALVVNKVNLPGRMRLTKPEYDRIMKAIDKRKAKHDDISGHTKSSKKPTGAK